MKTRTIRILKVCIDRMPPQKERNGTKVLNEVQQWKQRGEWYVSEWEEHPDITRSATWKAGCDGV